MEKYPIESTPFRLLLGEGVDLARDSRVVGVEGDEGSLAITLEDKGGKATGQIKLYFDTAPEMKLKPMGHHRRARARHHGNHQRYSAWT